MTRQMSLLYDICIYYNLARQQNYEFQLDEIFLKYRTILKYLIC